MQQQAGGMMQKQQSGGMMEQQAQLQNKAMQEAAAKGSATTATSAATSGASASASASSTATGASSQSMGQQEQRGNQASGQAGSKEQEQFEAPPSGVLVLNQMRSFRMRSGLFGLHKSLHQKEEELPITDADSGMDVLKVKVLHEEDKFLIQDLRGNLFLRVHRHNTSPPRFTVKNSAGKHVAEVHHKLTEHTDHIKMKAHVEGDLVVEGQLAKHEYSMRQAGNVIAVVSTAWYPSQKDSYALRVQPGGNAALCLAACLIMEHLQDDGGHRVA